MWCDNAWGEKGAPLHVETDREGLVHVVGVPRGTPLVVGVEVLELMLTAAHAEGRRREAEWTKAQKN